MDLGQIDQMFSHFLKGLDWNLFEIFHCQQDGKLMVVTPMGFEPNFGVPKKS